jgi:hypothetical protein
MRRLYSLVPTAVPCASVRQQARILTLRLGDSMIMRGDASAVREIPGYLVLVEVGQSLFFLCTFYWVERGELTQLFFGFVPCMEHVAPRFTPGGLTL